MEIKFRKLRADEIDVRVGNIIKTSKFSGCSLLLYKDARVDMNILDETVGCLNWQRLHSRENANCRVGIWDSEKNHWVWKEDTGTESFSEAEKGLASDSFKRACTNIGIGRELYTAKNILVNADLEQDDKGKWRLAKGISWQVGKIGYDEFGNINELEIYEITKADYTLVYSLTAKSGVKTEKKQTLKQEVETENKADKKAEYEKALEFEISSTEGQNIKLNKLSISALDRLAKSKDETLKEAKEQAIIILKYEGLYEET